MYNIPFFAVTGEEAFLFRRSSSSSFAMYTSMELAMWSAIILTAEGLRLCFSTKA